MKRIFLLSIVAAIAVAMTFVSCGEKKSAENTEEPLAEGFTLVTTPDGAKGIKKGGDILLEPKADYKDIAAVGGMFIAKTETGQTLIDPGTGYSRIDDADTLVWKDFFFEAQKGENYLIYVPAYKLQFAGQAYAVAGEYAIAVFNGKFSIWKAGEQILEPNSDYERIAILPDGKLLCFKKAWGTATIKNKAIAPGSGISPKDLKKYQAMKGWDDKSPVMILE